MMYLYFEHNDGSQTFVCECTEEQVFEKIKAFILTKNPKFKIYYIRSWFNEHQTAITYDVGSHTEFFHLRKVKL